MAPQAHSVSPLSRNFALIVTDPVLKQLALEVVSMQSVDTMMKISVIDRCLQTGDELLIGSSLGCLAGIGELRRISPAVIVRVLRADPPFSPISETAFTWWSWRSPMQGNSTRTWRQRGRSRRPSSSA
jgi:hypothetical protein